MALLRPVAHWPLHSEAYGVVDAAGQSNGVLESLSEPVWDDGLLFNGQMRVQISPSGTLNYTLEGPFTVTAWIRAGPHHGCRVLSNRGDSGFEIVAPRTDSKKVTLWLGGDHRNIGLTDVDDNEWHHLVVTFKTSDDHSHVQVGLYVDGRWDLASEEGERFDVRDTRPLASTAPMCIGDWKGHPGHGYEGHIRDVMIFQGLLSQDDVTAVHTAAPSTVMTKAAH